MPELSNQPANTAALVQLDDMCPELTATRVSDLVYNPVTQAPWAIVLKGVMTIWVLNRPY